MGRNAFEGAFESQSITKLEWQVLESVARAQCWSPGCYGRWERSLAPRMPWMTCTGADLVDGLDGTSKSSDEPLCTIGMPGQPREATGGARRSRIELGQGWWVSRHRSFSKHLEKVKVVTYGS